MKIDKLYMRIAIELARKADGLTNPNPIVGALVVKNGDVVGLGYHKACGLMHAEINALNEAGRKSRGATLYVTLEPCDHFGRTPPCTDAIIKSGIRRVVIGTTDPNPINNGRGIKRLSRYGIKTLVGVLEEEARSMNAPYIKYITKKLPYVTVKVAESLDGKIATRTGDSKWITNKESRLYVHRLRGKVDAVMVGINTVLADDPLLMSNAPGNKQPIRIIVDSRLKTPLNAKVFSSIQESPVIIATGANADPKEVLRYEKKGAVVIGVRSKCGRLDLKELLAKLAKVDIMHILVEGGGELIASMLESRLVDRLLFFIAPKIIGGSSAVTSVEGVGVRTMANAITMKDVTVKRFRDDIMIEARVN